MEQIASWKAGISPGNQEILLLHKKLRGSLQIIFIAFFVNITLFPVDGVTV
jgi:hypothetical protein